MQYKLAIFDLDGTILDTLDDLAESVNTVLRQFGYPERTKEEVRQFVGNGIHLLIERAVPKETSADATEAVYTAFLPYYTAHCMDNTKSYTGIPELLQQLRNVGCRTAVVSNKAHTAVQTLCEQYFPGQFDTAFGERAGIARKPAPDTVNAVLEQLGIAKEDAVYIGDSDVDILTAKNAGMDCISVDWGFRDRAFLLEHGAKTIVSDTQELLEKIL